MGLRGDPSTVVNKQDQTPPPFPRPWELSESHLPLACPVCGEQQYQALSVMWAEIIQAWKLDPEEVKLMDRQQGFTCRNCRCNLRVMTLAGALNAAFDWRGTLREFIDSEASQKLRVLEINDAGDLHEYLRLLPGHTKGAYPAVDLQNMTFADETFDLVVHSDTLEHVPDPIRALRECRRVLRPHGFLIITVPIVPSKMSRRCTGDPPSYHSACSAQEDWRVWTEYGSDFYLDFIAAGWNNVTLFTLGSAAAFALVAAKQPVPFRHLDARAPTVHHIAPPSPVEIYLRQNLREARNSVRLGVRRGLRAVKRIRSFASRFSPL